MQNYWKLEVPNGFYNVTLYGGQYNYRNLYGYMCAVGNVQMIPGTVNYGSWAHRYWDYWQLVEVHDGVLTVQGGSDDTNMASQEVCDSIAALKIEPVEDLTMVERSWLPPQNDPWLQIELDDVLEVGLVSIFNQDLTHCSSYWLYIGNKCRPADTGKPMHKFHGLHDYSGFTVRVSLDPCTSKSCSGYICGGNGTAASEHHVSCNGYKGKYVSVTFPGADRVLSLDYFTVHTTQPKLLVEEGTPNICYGLQPMAPTSTRNEYEISYDTEDPIFYSTCFVREKDITWLNLGEKVVGTPWRFNANCVECEAYHNNQNLPEFYTPKWPMSFNDCYDCDSNVPPVVDSDMRTYEDRYCHPDTEACTLLGYEADYCQKRLYMPFRETDRYTNFVNLDECHSLARADDECGNVYYHDDLNNYCYCVRKDECCVGGNGAGCYLTDTVEDLRDVYEIDMGEPNPACEGGILSGNGILCCHPDCVDHQGNSVCGVEGTDGDYSPCLMPHVPAMCCETGLLKYCDQAGFPCLVPTAPTNRNKQNYLH